MKQLLDFILGFIRGLLGQPRTEPPRNEPVPSETTTETECSLGFHELPPEVDTSDVPFVGEQAVASVAEGCIVTVRPELGIVNVRTGPRIGFFPAGVARGGTIFKLSGASEPDPTGFRWYQVEFGTGSGWIRSDLVTLTDPCREFSFITDADYPTTPTPPVTTRFPLPTTARVSGSYSRTRHPGIDFATQMGTPIRASTDGTIIRRVVCQRCSDARPNIFPCGQAIYNDPAWGYGYGNFVVVRHDYADVPAPLREAMDDADLTGGFVYVLYAHFQQLSVDFGENVNATTLLGHTGNHGCSTGPHIHIEIRMGNVEIVDGRWLLQTSVNPNLFFTV